MRTARPARNLTRVPGKETAKKNPPEVKTNI